MTGPPGDTDYAFPPTVPRPPVLEPDPVGSGVPAQDASVARLLLVCCAAVLYSAGWLAGSILLPLIAAGRWVFAAFAVGWDDAGNRWRPRQED